MSKCLRAVEHTLSSVVKSTPTLASYRLPHLFLLVEFSPLFSTGGLWLCIFYSLFNNSELLPISTRTGPLFTALPGHKWEAGAAETWTGVCMHCRQSNALHATTPALSSWLINSRIPKPSFSNIHFIKPRLVIIYHLCYQWVRLRHWIQTNKQKKITKFTFLQTLFASIHCDRNAFRI